MGRDSPIAQQPPASWRPSRFAPPVAARSSDGFDQELAERVAEDAERCLREHLLIPTIRRYSPAVDPERNRFAAQEVAHQVLTASGPHRQAVKEWLADRHPTWLVTLSRALNALELIDDVPRNDTAPAAVGPELADGKPRFLVGDRIARGSGGTVHRCIDRLHSDGSTLPIDAEVDLRDDAPGHLVVKLLPRVSRSADPWHPEARFASKVAAPCGIRIVDSGDASNGAAYIVMERVDGLTLAAIAAAERQVDPLGAMRELALLAMALSMLHAEGLGHGDISPMNIMLDRSGNLRMLDFGAGGSASADRDVRALAALGLWLSLGCLPRKGAAIPWGPPTMRRALATASIEAINGGLNAAGFADRLQEQSRKARILRSIVTVTAIGALIGTLLYLAPAGASSRRGGLDAGESPRTAQP